jgi:hypothetical protein
LVAHVLVSKYAWHLPLYRQTQILLAQGIEIERSVLAFWVGYAAAELMPLWRRLRDILLGSPRLFVDDRERFRSARVFRKSRVTDCGEFVTCAAFASTKTKSPSLRICHTGFQ